MITRYHAKYYAYLLSQQSVGEQLSSLSQSLLNAAVDINPHQIDAALFAFKSPLSKGIVLADEVGLGKTIEAGLVLCQYWSTGKRNIIVVCPASLRKQWESELLDKFGLKSEILDTKNYNALQKEGKNPFDPSRIVICSYTFCAKHKGEILTHGFQLAVIDEAHKMRNVYRSSARTMAEVRDALYGSKKLLLTATPFQNSLLELYGLTSVIDDKIFGSEKSFRAEYGNGTNLQQLRRRISSIFTRTLRKDVKEYINYTKRLPLTQEFNSSDPEYALYQEVSEFLRRDDIYSVPASQKKLTTMIVRKILASSSYALVFTLQHIKDRLEKMLERNRQMDFDASEIIDDEDSWLTWQEDEDDRASMVRDDSSYLDQEIDIPRLQQEIKTLEGFIVKAQNIKRESKAEALLTALKNAFFILEENGANRKALIFTESTKTQAFLCQFLEANGYAGKIVLFNGKASEPQTNAIYNAWCKAHPDKMSGIKAADRRAAIVDYFRDEAEIMIATEAASEGLNLQFCSLLINYDLGWNPQRIEQRIGRCHRYGQKHDVVVVNFINKRNFADVRVYELLSNKFKLFDDVFGASDEVLGKADSIDIESRIWEIYQQCRTEEEINAAFEQLQAEMQTSIDERMDKVRAEVMENFDINVQEHLRTRKDDTGAFLNRYQHMFWELTRFVLGSKAVFDDEHHTFFLKTPVAAQPRGRFALLGGDSDCHAYRLGDELGQYVVNSALSLQTGDEGSVVFREDALSMNANLPDYMQGQEGYLILSQLAVTSVEEEQHSIFSAYTMDGRTLSQEDVEKLFLNGGEEADTVEIPSLVLEKLQKNNHQHGVVRLKSIDSRNLEFFEQEKLRLQQWVDDQLNALEQEIKTVKSAIRQAERDASTATTIETKIAAERKVDELNRRKRKLRNELEDREDEIQSRRKQLIRELESKLIKQSTNKKVFIIHWKTV
ncbi:MAG: DEAD/DEAH box helicase family protein [Bacteroidales bacterium]|nr:DEAD/DEAH box helicase family protein [Candidatus Liminaster caballi]